MNKYKVYVQWQTTDSGVFEVEAEDEDAANDKVILENDDIGEDYQIDRTVFLGECDTAKEPIYVNPNQLNLNLETDQQAGEK